MRSQIVLCGFVLLSCAVGCEKPPAPKASTPPPPVMVAKVQKKTVPVQLRTIGTVKAMATVAVRPRVGGQLVEVLFQEGDNVEKGQKLMVIDPRPYEAAVKLAEATLAKSNALLKGAELELSRVERVGTDGAASGTELDAARTNAASARAAVGVDQAALDSAKLQLSFTTITAPLTGRVGELLVNVGNLVEPNEPNPLVVINQVSPIYVSFALPEALLPGVAAARKERPLKIEAYLRDGEPPIVGTLAFVDNAVNTGSGTVLIKADFANTDRKLWPGQFVDVVLTLRDRENSLVVPTRAVQSGQQGNFVFVVTPEKKAILRPVIVAFENGADAVIESGVSEGETVVTDGQLRLVNETIVEIKSPNRGSPVQEKAE